VGVFQIKEAVMTIVGVGFILCVYLAGAAWNTSVDKKVVEDALQNRITNEQWEKTNIPEEEKIRMFQNREKYLQKKMDRIMEDALDPFIVE
jgi:hypothetical protein